MSLWEIEKLEYEVAASFKDLAKQTSLLYTLKIANVLLRSKDLDNLIHHLTVIGESVGDSD